MTTHQELLDQQRIIGELEQLIPIQARTAEISEELRGRFLPPLMRGRLLAELVRLQRQEQALVTSLADANVSVDDPAGELGARRAAFNTALAELITGLDPDVPLVLLPVRLETRFLPSSSARSTDLLVRIYPDDIHLDRHEAELTAEESQWGKLFWDAMTAAGPDRQKQKEVWIHLATRFGPRRAAWIARSLDGHRAAPGSRPSDWNRAEQAGCLP